MDNYSGRSLGRYHIIEPLGQGGMASVYKAYDTTLERYLAIKIIRTDIGGGDSQFLARFLREARALAKLDHPFILKVLDYGEQEGVPYLVMPFMQSGTLKEKMGHPIVHTQAAALLAPIADALDYAHKQGIIHRDVKPANILISESGAPLLSDFGIAKILSGEESTQLTATGVGIGTPDYMAPEQWLGTADARTDIYSLGVVFYEMVTGHRPFAADTPAAVLLKHMNDPLPRPGAFISGLPEEVEHVLFKALAKEADNRFQTMGNFREALEKLSRGEHPGIQMDNLATVLAGSRQQAQPSAVETRMAAAPQPAKTKSNTRTIALLAVVGVVALGLICALAGGTYLFSRVTSPQRDSTATGRVEETVPVQKTTAAESPAVTNEPGLTLPAPIDVPTGNSTPFTSINGFPEDIPFLTNNNGDLMTTNSQGMQMYAFTSNESFDQLSIFYKTGMEKNGWSLTSETTQSGEVLWYFSKGDNRMVMITLSVESDMANRIAIILVNQ